MLVHCYESYIHSHGFLFYLNIATNPVTASPVSSSFGYSYVHIFVVFMLKPQKLPLTPVLGSKSLPPSHNSDTSQVNRVISNFSREVTSQNTQSDPSQFKSSQIFRSPANFKSSNNFSWCRLIRFAKYNIYQIYTYFTQATSHSIFSVHGVRGKSSHSENATQVIPTLSHTLIKYGKWNNRSSQHNLQYPTHKICEEKSAPMQYTVFITISIPVKLHSWPQQV